MALLEIRDLCVDFTGAPPVRAVDGVNLLLAARECLAIVGESGSGKSQLLFACTGLLAANGSARGSVRFDGAEILGDPTAMARVRGRGIGFVFQDAGGSLTPHRRIGPQLAEAASATRGLTRADALTEARRMLERVHLPDAGRRLTQYPHELSGGMRQRVAIAAALMPKPRLLFADEPTTALDVTVQAEVLALLAGLVRDLEVALVLVTHDLAVALALADRVAVMYAGRIVEHSPAKRFLAGPAHPYGAGLLAALPRLDDVPGAPFRTIAGQPPRPGDVFAACRFEPRCPRAQPRCREQYPALAEVAPGVESACHFPLTGPDR